MSKISKVSKKVKILNSDCDYKDVNNVLHIIYTDNIPEDVIEIADIYEGKIKNRIGINFPMNIVDKYKGDSNIKKYNCDYIIVYKKGDKLTKEHELMHAKYYMDEKYKEKVKNIWKDMEDKNKDKVKKMLKKMGYPENEDILIDEFQAYYYTEKTNFFGKF
jgi:hypothetical protein